MSRPMNVHAPTSAAPRRMPFLAAACIGLTLWTSAGLAQVANLDQSTLIDALTDEGMNELLLHLIETEPPDDPVVQAQIEIAQHRLRYADGNLPRDQQLHAFDQALNRLRKLIADLPEHEQRPLWQTDLAEMLLVEYLGVIHQNASEFYQFGIPTAEQTQAVEDAAVEALELTTAASLQLFQLQTTLPRQSDHVEKRVNTGLWTRMMDDYGEKRTPFFLGQASQLVATLPDDHPYFRRPNPHIPDRRDAADEEKKRLVAHARQLLQPFVDDTSDQTGIRIPALSLIGRALLAIDEPDAAMQSLQAVITANRDDLFDLVAHLAAARANQIKGRFPTALDQLTAMEDHPLLKRTLLYRLLVVDAQHRVLLAQADHAPANQRQAALTVAYQPYLNLLDSPSLGDDAAALRNFIFQRWAATLPPDQDPGSVPPVVRMAIGEMERIQGQNLAVESEKTGSDALMQQANRHLDRSIRFNQTLTGDDIPPSIRAQAMFNLGMAQYLADPRNLGNILGATSAFVKLADRMPDQPQAEEAIGYAMSLLRALHQLDQRPAGVDDAYREAAEVLFAKYPSSAAADNERLYYGYYVLVSAGRYVDAVDMLTTLPAYHPDYLAAQREALFALELAMQQASGQQQADIRDRLRNHAEQIQQEVAGSTNPAARSAHAAARLVLASAAVTEDQTDQAIRHLTGFEDTFEDQPQLVQIALERRIVALAQAGRMQQLASSATRMMRDFPDTASAVIDEVLARIDQRIEQLRAQADAEVGNLRRQERQGQAAQLAATALTLSELLVQWARDQNYDAQQMLPFELIHAKSLRLVGETRQATDITQRLIDTFPDDPDVMFSHAESLFTSDDRETLIRATRLYDRLIQGLPAPYPPLWWNAWMRRLQINDRLDEGTADIPLRVRQLKRTDPDLGGPRYREVLERLAEKHQ